MKRKITMSDILIESIFDSIEEDKSILKDDPRLSERSFKRDVKNTEQAVDRILGRLKREQGLIFNTRMETILSKCEKFGYETIEKIFNTVVPDINKQLIIQFNRQLKSDRDNKIEKDDVVYLKIIDHIDEIEKEIDGIEVGSS